MCVEKMKTAILHGIPIESAFALPQMMPMQNMCPLYSRGLDMRPAGDTCPPHLRARGRGSMQAGIHGAGWF